ncbi:Nif3-like dinuclear metal center hexameric protein [Candidatus Sumerlaeota bacterium]|nr:Nif3-like dinuclear metal center hexameric protein [Candidatus Sumerlaeota bacterium]
MVPTVQTLLRIIDARFPAPADSESRVRLEMGSPRKRVRRIGMTPRLAPEAVSTVLRRGYDLIVTFHPFLETETAPSLRTDKEPGASAARLLRAGIALVSVGRHMESADVTRGRRLAEFLGVGNNEILPLRPVETVESSEVKFVVFVPEGHEDAVIEAIARGGAGKIGLYSHCTFRSTGTGTYRPLEGADPWAGKVGRLESAPEARLEARVPRSALDRVLREVRTVHPYEEMAYDVFPLLEPRESRQPAAHLVALKRPTRLATLCARLRRASLPPLVATNAKKGRFAAEILSGEPHTLPRKIVVCGDRSLSVSDVRAIAPEPIDAIVRPAAHEPAFSGESEIPVVEFNPAVAESAVLKDLWAVLVEEERIAPPIDLWM